MSDNQLFQSIKYELSCDSLKANEIYGKNYGPSSNGSTSNGPNTNGPITGTTGYFQYIDSIDGQIDNFTSATGIISNFYSDISDIDTIYCNNLYSATGIYGKDITATGNISGATGSFGNITSASFYLVEIFNSNLYNKTDHTLSFGYRSSSAGRYNTAFGSDALKGNVTSNSNTAFGYQALLNLKNGDGGNTAIGTGALIFCSPTGESNTAVGWGSSDKAKGSYNTSIGAFSNAGYNQLAGINSETYGSYNTCIGYNAKVSTDQAIGEVVLGDANVTILRCKVNTISGLSDKRDKTNITNLKSCLNFINELKPVTFNWDRRELYNTGVPDGSKKEEKITTGFIAQDLKEVQEKHNMEYLNLVYDSNPEKLEATPGNLLAPLIKAVQELTALVNTQQKEIEELKLNK